MMRSTLDVSRVSLLAAALLLIPGAAAAGGLDSFLDEIDVTARVDVGSFKADLRVAFDVDDNKIDAMFEMMSKPSDVYMCLRVGEVARQPVDRVITEYKAHQGQGWGVIAKNLGIKPGSEEFHALKANKLGSGSGKGSGGKSKGRNG